MNTIQINIQLQDERLRELLIAQLSEQHYDAFEENQNELLAFISENNFDAEILTTLLSPFSLSYSLSPIPEQNWNALWESNFQPVIVDDFCAVRADFHAPPTDVQHDIIITPKMSFGTGHHATTYMMLSEMRKIDFRNKSVADFGTGTGVLAILAEKLGSKQVWASDNDEWSILNSKENAERNDCTHLIIEKAEGFETKEQFDIVLANINRNVILANAANLLRSVAAYGKLLISGLIKNDEPDIAAALTSGHLKHLYTIERESWLCLLFQHQSET